jgi:hypothetical protein
VTAAFAQGSFAMEKGSDNLLVMIAALLDDSVQQLNAGFDVAPAQRLSLEGLTRACLAAGMTAETLLQFCRQRLPADTSVYLNSAGSALQFELWQQRAPVYPSTSE